MHVYAAVRYGCVAVSGARVLMYSCSAWLQSHVSVAFVIARAAKTACAAFIDCVRRVTALNCIKAVYASTQLTAPLISSCALCVS
jgi:hypothetical protein